MKIQIILTDAEVKGFTKYLEQVGNYDKVTKTDITNEIQSLVSGNLHSPREAVSDYVNQYES